MRFHVPNDTLYKRHVDFVRCFYNSLLDFFPTVIRAGEQYFKFCKNLHSRYTVYTLSTLLILKCRHGKIYLEIEIKFKIHDKYIPFYISPQLFALHYIYCCSKFKILLRSDVLKISG